jgi:hypothetical protein
VEYPAFWSLLDFLNKDVKVWLPNSANVINT